MNIQGNEGTPWGNSRGRGRRKQNANSSTAQSGWPKNSKSTARLEQTRLQHEQASKRVLQSYESSSEEEDLDEESILDSLMKNYKGTLQGREDDVNSSSTSAYLFESCQSGGITCLVCISTVKRQEAIWSCSGCYAIFHLPCIQRWVREGNARRNILSDEHFPNKENPWFCPKCRFEYKQHECPTKYTCHCGKTYDPPFDPWLVPHSCGETCDRPLQPACGHKCLLLCHPGPCPPCPKTVRVSCFCEKKPQTTRRCGAASWSCGEKCEKLLACGIHRCQENCHSGECSTCTHTSIQKCVCGKNRREQPCASSLWNCKEECGRSLPCGFHSCEKVCHMGKCGGCPRSGFRTCPCGKSSTDALPCTEDIPTCNDTCGKGLGCYGGHRCTRRCHYGPCGPCPLLVEKKCRCGKRKKETPCHREYTCDVKCQRMRDCGNHQCKRKCCNGECPTCEQVCGRTLQCKRHKCQSRCHQGPCYPCILTSRISCKCGSSGITVVCGKEKLTKPPRCRKPCTTHSSCHHTSRKPHYCHFGECPKCKQVCDINLKCGHKCPADCHDEVLVKSEVKAAGPWELLNQCESTIKCLPCPPCKYPVPKRCLGDHETSNLPCYEAKRYCCGRKCGRQLSCGNHTCSLLCHAVIDVKDDITAGKNCAECEEPCSKTRPEGCTHACPLTCHSDPCLPCKKRIRSRCHCGMIILHHICSEWTAASSDIRNKMESCGNNCPKFLSCGHLCPLICHTGACPGPEQCKKKLNIRCDCKRKKKEFRCSEVQKGAAVECDDVCEEIKTKKNAEIEEKQREKKEEEERLQQIELEKFERKMQKSSKSRRRKRSVNLNEENEGNSFIHRQKFRIGFIVSMLILMSFGYYLVLYTK